MAIRLQKLHKLLFLPLLALCLLLPTIASAADVTTVIKLPKSDVSVSKTIIKNGAYEVELKPTAPSGTSTKLITSDSAGVKFNQTAFENATDKSRKQALGNFVKDMQNSSMSEQSQQKVFDDMSALNSDVSSLIIPLVMDSTSADVYTAMKITNPFLGFVRVVIGVIVIATIIFLTLSTAVDLIYIGLPLFRENVQNRADEKGKSKPPFISQDAVSVVNETESSVDSNGGYQNAYILYFKRRALTYVVLAVCIVFFVVGQVGDVIGWLLSLGNGFTN